MDLEINKSFKDLIPALSVDEYQTLEKNVLRDGIREPLVIWNGTLVDGHNRYEIAKKHDLHIPTVDYQFDSEEDAKMWIINNQLGRRNLTSALRIELALLLEPLIRKKAKENQGKGMQISAQGEVVTRKEVAKLAGVSHDTVSKYKKVKENATPEILEQVKRGEKKINTVFREMQTGTKICSICKSEKPKSDFPANGVTYCNICRYEKESKPKDPRLCTKQEVQEFERYLHRPAPTTNKIKALNVVDGFAFQVKTYTTNLKNALGEVTDEIESQEIIQEFACQIEILNNFMKELKNEK